MIEKYGFMDESGSPGIKTSDNDWLVVSLVIFSTKEYTEFINSQVESLRKKLKLPIDYEFHFARNSSRPQAEFLKFIETLKFEAIIVGLKKTNNRAFASYNTIIERLFSELTKKYHNIKIEMDENPILYKTIKEVLKYRRLTSIKIRQQKSRSNNLVQIADYISAISARKFKQEKRRLKIYKKLDEPNVTIITIKTSP